MFHGTRVAVISFLLSGKEPIFQTTHQRSTALLADLLCRISLKSGNGPNVASADRNALTSAFSALCYAHSHDFKKCLWASLDPNFMWIAGKIKGEMEVTRRRGGRRKKLLDDLKDRRGHTHLKEEALDRTMWRTRFGGGFGPVVRQNTERMNEWRNKCKTFEHNALPSTDCHQVQKYSTTLRWDLLHQISHKRVNQ